MNKLNLTQLNKQRVAEREMKDIEGGALPPRYANYEQLSRCGYCGVEFIGEQLGAPSSVWDLDYTY